MSREKELEPEYKYDFEVWDVEFKDEDGDCVEQYEHGCQDCPDYECPYRDNWRTDPYDEEEGRN